MDHCAWWKGLRRHLDEMRGCRVGTNYRIWLGKQCYKLNCHSSKKVANFFRSWQVTALNIILSRENIFKGCCNTEVMMVVHTYGPISNALMLPFVIGPYCVYITLGYHVYFRSQIKITTIYAYL